MRPSADSCHFEYLAWPQEAPLLGTGARRVAMKGADRGRPGRRLTTAGRGPTDGWLETAARPKEGGRVRPDAATAQVLAAE